eukprot:89911_1
MFVVVILFTTVILNVNSITAEFTSNNPCCKSANVPFSEEEALLQSEMYVNCWYQYYVEGNSYKGPKGYEKIVGVEGYLFSKYTEFDFDGKSFTGYEPSRTRAMTGNNLWVMIDEPYDFALVDSAEYMIAYTYTAMIKFKIPAFSGNAIATKVNVKVVFDEKGVVKEMITNSGSGAFGQVLSTMIDKTAAISNFMGFLDVDEHATDHNQNYYMFGFNPVFVVFIIILILSTIWILIIVYFVCRCGFQYFYTKNRKYEKVKTYESESDSQS